MVHIVFAPETYNLCATQKDEIENTHTHTFRAHCIYIKWYLMSAISVGNHA